MIRRTIGWTALMLIVGVTPAVDAACHVNDSDFTTTDGGCKDLDTGLVWSPDFRGIPGATNGDGISAAGSPDFCERILDSYPAGNGGYTDWRIPTVAEVEEAIANGLKSHLDFFSDGRPDDGVYRWTGCTKKIKRDTYRYGIRYADGNVALFTQNGTVSGVQIICVRGVPADTANDCPGGPGKKNNRSGATSALSQTSTGALLLLPLAVVLAARYVQARRP